MQLSRRKSWMHSWKIEESAVAYLRSSQSKLRKWSLLGTSLGVYGIKVRCLRRVENKYRKPVILTMPLNRSSTLKLLRRWRGSSPFLCKCSLVEALYPYRRSRQRRRWLLRASHLGRTSELKLEPRWSRGRQGWGGRARCLLRTSQRGRLYE